MNTENKNFLDQLDSISEVSSYTIEELEAEAKRSLEGKSNVPMGQTPPAEQNQETAAGDSSLVDSSLESPVQLEPINFNLRELYQSEEKVVNLLNERIAQYGLIAEEAVAGRDAIIIKKRARKDDATPTAQGALKPTSELSSIITLKGGFLGLDGYKDIDILNKEINDRIAKLADVDYIKNSAPLVSEKYNDFKEAVKPGELSEEELQESLISARNAEMENLQKSVAKEFGIKENVDLSTLTDIPGYADIFESEKQKEDYIKWRNDDVTFTKDELLFADQKRKEEQVSEASRKFFNYNTQEWERQAIEAIKENELKYVALESKSIKDDILSFNEDKEEFEKQVDLYNSKDQPTQEEYLNLLIAQTNILEKGSDLQGRYNALSKYMDEEKDAALWAIEDAGREYNRFDQTLTNFQRMIIPSSMYLLGQLAGGAGFVFEEYAQDKGVADYLKRLEQSNKEVAIELEEEYELELQRFQRDLKFEEIGGISSAAQWVAGSLTNLVPSLALAATGPYALPIFFMTGAGSAGIEIERERLAGVETLTKYNSRYGLEYDNKGNIINQGSDEWNNLNLQDKQLILQELREAARAANITDVKKLTSQTLKGTAEVIFERFGTISLLNKWKKGFQSIDELTIKTGARAAAGAFLKGARVEGSSEYATLLVDNWTDIHILGKDKNYFEDGLETFAQGSLMGIGLSGAPTFLKQGIVNHLTTRAQKKELEQIVSELNEVLGTDNLYDTEQGTINLDSFDQETRDKVLELTAASDGIKNAILEAFVNGEFTAQQLFEIGELQRIMTKANDTFVRALNSNLNAAELKKIKDKQRKIFDTAAAKKDEILNQADATTGAENKISFEAQESYKMYEFLMSGNLNLVARTKLKYEQLSKLEKQKILSAAKSALESRNEEATEDQLEEEAYKIFFKKESETSYTNGKANAKKYAESQGLDIEFIEEFDEDSLKEALNKLLNDKKITKDQHRRAFEAIEAGTFVGVNYDNQKDKNKNIIVVNGTAAVERGQYGVFAHEVLHAKLKSLLGNAKDANIQTIGQEFLDYLESSHPEFYGKIMFRLEQNYQEKDGTYNLEEALTVFSDLLAAGETIDISIVEQAMLVLNKVFKRKLFNSGRSTFNFLKDFNNAAHFGGKAKYGTSITYAAIQPEEETTDETTDRADFSRVRSTEKQNLFDAIKAIQPKEATTKQEFQEDPGFMALYEATMQGGVIHNYIVSQFPGQTDKIRMVAESVQDRLINFDPAKKRKDGSTVGVDGFVEFIMSISGVQGAVLDANKKLAQEAARQRQGSSIDSEGAKQIAEVSPISEEIITNRPEYKDLLQRKIVDEAVVQAIEEKVLRTVALLKSPIDAKVSKNVTVTPIIREIKKEVGKQVDIDIKQAMGGKKDGQLRKFLIRNKGAILQNMSTTWLSQAMPFAIQKKVNGEWTSDWKGKKIDRETTATDLAGRTSGAELVRRVPKASSVISDELFLSSIVDSKGAPLRGKKESLAKAIAEEISFDIIKKALQNPNSTIAQALIENQKRLGVENAENLGPEFNRQAERGNVKFLLAPKVMTNIFETSKKFEQLPRGAVQARMRIAKNGLNIFLRDNDIAEIYDFSQADGPNGYRQYFIALRDSGLLKTMPKEFWFPVDKRSGKPGKGTPLLNKSSISKNADFNKIREELFKFFKDYNDYGAPIKGIDAQDLRAESYKKLMPDAATAKKNRPQIRLQNAKQRVIHETMWTRIAELVEKDKQTLRPIVTFMSMSVNDTAHPQRTGAMITAWESDLGKNTIVKEVIGKDGKKKKNVTTNIEYEHSFPSLNVAMALLEAAVSHNSNFSKYYQLIADNYRLVALNKSTEKRIAPQYKRRMSEHYDILYGTWWNRYFNRFTAIRGGIDPANMEHIGGRTLQDITGIDSRGNVFNAELFEKIKKALKKELEAEAGKELSYLEFYEKAGGKEKTIMKLSEAMVMNFASAKRNDGVFSKAKDYGDINKRFNEMLERQSGIPADQQFSRTRAQLAGKNKGRFKFFVAPGAEDFRGLVHYAFAGQGKQGDLDMQFFEDVLMKPYFKGIAVMDTLRQNIKRDFKTVKKEYKQEYKLLQEEIAGTPFTYDQALRVYMWTLQDTKIPGMNENDISVLLEAINEQPKLIEFAEALMLVARTESWPKPSTFWEGESVLSDLNSMTEKIGRKEIIAEFIENADILFSTENLNKIEAIKGRKHREALEDALYAMKNGSNRPSGANRQLNAWLNWINGSTGAIMFFNRRSALLQMLSFTNFINWSDNNPLKAAMAYANQPQFWKDFAFIFNSDKLKERRGGLKQDVSDSELAQVANRSKNSPQAIIAYLLKIGFKPTQLADSFAIATGGAVFYRNRLNTYLKQGMSQEAAEEQAFLDFSMKSDEAQQSSDPALVSQEQRSVLGRLVLAFANTPMQYTRLMKKAGLDLINGRGDWKTNVSKIAYYGFVQNFIFSSLQSALFALAFDDDEEELDEKAAEKKAKDEQRKISNTINSMMDTVLRGSGVYGAIVSTIKNVIRTYYAQEEKGFMADHAYTIINIFNVSPPIGSKLKKVYGAIQTKKFEKDSVAARGWGLTADGKLNLGPNWAILGQLTSATLNLPLDRVVDELKSVSEALDSRNKAWQRIALALGWKTWDVGARNEEADLIKLEAQERRKKEGVKKAKETRRKNKQKEIIQPQKLYTEEELEKMTTGL